MVIVREKMRVYFCSRFQYNISANKKLIVMKKAFILLLMQPVIDNIPVLVVVLVLTFPVAILAMRLAERLLKKNYLVNS